MKLANSGAVLRDAWPTLRADDAAGLRRLARLVDQRHRSDGIVDITAVAPIITLLLEDDAPWRSAEHTQGLLRDWLRAHAVAETPAGDPLRIRLRERLVEMCSAADRRLAEQRKTTAAARATRMPDKAADESWRTERHRWLMSQIGVSSGGRRRRPRPEIAHEITDKIVVELLALLGADLGNGGEAILRRIARDAPAKLAPAVDELLTGRALAGYRRGLLAHLTEAYYVDDEADGSGFSDYGVRKHRARSFGVVPLAAWYRGPFMSLLQTDFSNGVAMLNRLLNHAAGIRVRILARPYRAVPVLRADEVGSYQTELKITGTHRIYVGDDNVWRWYRGTGVGPYPCLSALQALERVCDQLIENSVPIRSLLAILLNGCENLAMVGLVVGILVRHLESANHLLDPYLTEPFIWHQEFARVVGDRGQFAADSTGLVASERRTWSLREAATALALRAKGQRVVELRELGNELVANARRDLECTRSDERTQSEVPSDDLIEQRLAVVRAWASCLDRARYRAHRGPDGLYIQAVPPQDVVQTLQRDNEHLDSVQERARLVVRYWIEPGKSVRNTVNSRELEADIGVARKLIDDARSSGVHDSWDAPALVAAAALKAQFVDGTDLRMDTLSFAADTVLRIGEGEAGLRPMEFEETYCEQAADRSAARAVPVLLLPAATALRAVVGGGEEQRTFNRAARAGMRLARSVANEVRLHLAHGLDPLWETPCADAGRCQHEIGLQIATETMRDCILGIWDPVARRRSPVVLAEPVATSLEIVSGESVLPLRLDAAVRALATAAVADICVSTQARVLLLALLGAHRRSLLSGDRDEMDDRGSHTLVGARALLTLATRGDDSAVCEHINAYADNPALLGALLRALSAAAEEATEHAATARRIWPKVVRHVLKLNDSGHTLFRDHDYGDTALAAAIPNAAGEVQYLYREIQDGSIAWWEPLTLMSEVEAWLKVAAGNATCADQLVGFLGVLSEEDQVRTGLPWVATLVLADAARIAGRTFLLTDWLIERRAAADKAGLLAKWQEVVDALVVAGVTRLAPYSE